MMNYRSIGQGAYAVTSDGMETLVTCGMTECIAVAFVDKKNPKNRLLAHLDGLTLDRAVVKKNIQTLVTAFQTKTEVKEFDVYCLGGQKKLDNIPNLRRTFDELKLSVTKEVDSIEFCALHSSLKFKLTPMMAQITMICPAVNPPEFKLYNRSLFNPPLSLAQLEAGEGLTEPHKKEQYQLFNRVNDIIFNHFFEESKYVRCYEEEEKIKKYSSFEPPKPKPLDTEERKTLFLEA